MLQLTLLAVAVLLVGFAVLVWKSSPDRDINRRFTTFTLLVACWAVGVAASHSGQYPTFWARITFASASFLPPAFLALTRAFPPAQRWPSRNASRAIWSLGVVFATLSLFSDLVIRDLIVSTKGLTRQSGSLYPAFAFYLLTVWLSVMALFAGKWRSARGRARAQLQYLGAGMIVPAFGGVTTNLLIPLVTGQSSYSWVGPYFGLAFVVIAGHAIIRHRLMDLRLIIHRGLTVTISIMISSLPMALLIGALWPRIQTLIYPGEALGLIVLLAVVTLLIPVTRDTAKSILDRYVYRTRANYQRTVREASQMLTRVLNLRLLLSFLSRTVAMSTGAEGVAVYLSDEDGFRRTIGNKHDDTCRFDMPAHAPMEVIDAVRRTKQPIVTDEITREVLTSSSRALPRSLVNANWALVLPVLSEDTVIAVIVLGPKLSGDPYYPQDLDLLMTLANQAGIAIKNAQLYDQVVLANEYIENIVATIESGVIAVSASGQVVMFNRAAEQLTGLSATSTKGRSLEVLPICLSEPLRTSIVDGRATVQPEIELPNGTATLPAICTTSPLRDPDGTVLGAVAVFSDLTPLKELEVERRRAERLAYFEVLASGLAHEIKNPLVAIKTFMQLLPRRRNDDRFIDDFGRVATREMERMERLLERLRTLSGPGDRPRHPLDVRAPIREALESLQPACDEKNITMIASLGPAPCMVRGDHGELEQLFLNLFMNAHEATPPGGTVMIDLARTDEHVAVTVGDTGPGIPSDLLERVFDPFFTTKQRGAGLGLTICAGIAQTHGARLRAGNRAAGGACFSVEFSLLPVPAPVAR